MNLNDENDIEGKNRNEEVIQMMAINNSSNNNSSNDNTNNSYSSDHVDDTSGCESSNIQNNSDQDSTIDCRNILSSPLSICKNHHQQQHGLNRNSITLLSSAEKGKHSLLLKEHQQQQQPERSSDSSISNGNSKDEPNKFAPIRHGSPAIMRPSSTNASISSSPPLLTLGSSSTNHHSMQRTSSFRTCLKLLHLRISQPSSENNNNNSSSTTAAAAAAKFIVPEWAGRRASGSALHIVQDGEVVNTISLEDHAYIVFGRQPQCPCNLGTCYVLDHLSVSRQHAVILHHEKDDLSYIVDLQSVHGTFVNGKKINSYDPVLIEDRNVVAFGLSPTQYIMRLFPKLSQIQDKILNEQDISETDTKTKLHTHLNCMVSYHSSPRANDVFVDPLSSSSSSSSSSSVANGIGIGNSHVNNNIMMQLDNDPPLFSSTNSSEETSIAGSDSLDNDSQMNEFHNSATSLLSLTLDQQDASLTSASSTEAKMAPPPNGGADAFTFGSPTTTSQAPVFSMKRSKSLPSMYDTFENIEKSNISFSSLAVCPTTSADSIKPRSIRSPNGFNKSHSMSRRVSFSITEPEIIPCGSDPLFSLAISSLEQQHSRFKAHARSESSPALSAITPRDIFTARSFHIGEPCDDSDQGSEPAIDNASQQQNHQQYQAMQDGNQICIHGKRRHISTDSPSSNVAELCSPNKRQCCS